MDRKDFLAAAAKVGALVVMPVPSVRWIDDYSVPRSQGAVVVVRGKEVVERFNSIGGAQRVGALNPGTVLYLPEWYRDDARVVFDGEAAPGDVFGYAGDEWSPEAPAVGQTLSGASVPWVGELVVGNLAGPMLLSGIGAGKMDFCGTLAKRVWVDNFYVGPKKFCGNLAEYRRAYKEATEGMEMPVMRRAKQGEWLVRVSREMAWQTVLRNGHIIGDPAELFVAGKAVGAE